MYRQGQGDCYLLALPRQGGGDPVYVLIDCGFKPGSPAFLREDETDDAKSIANIVDHIGESTGNQLDLVVITHEHEDHVNGFRYGENPLFDRFAINEAWVAWTEDPDDELAEKLRKTHEDILLNLVQARNKMARAMGADDLAVRRIDALLGLELGPGPDGDGFPAAISEEDLSPATRNLKRAMKLIKDKARAHGRVLYRKPGDEPIVVPGTTVRAFVLGPPRDETLLESEEPRRSEAFPLDNTQGFSFSTAVELEAGEVPSPFSARFAVSLADSLRRRTSFFVEHYGKDGDGENDTDKIEVPDNASWRRIDDEWLFSAETLALRLAEGVNNTSLVLALELPTSRKVLLFVGDAQRGNWYSWKDAAWQENDTTITARELLERTVLYKVGHHGSHNATLKGEPDSVYANLSWMAISAAPGEFTAMIPAVPEWAKTQGRSGWKHPLPSIKQALLDKAQGRVLQTDETPSRERFLSEEAWEAFCRRCTVDDLYFDVDVLDA
jgi:hypothetical protein